MNSNKKTLAEREHPYAHLALILSAVIILLLIILDSFIFKISDQLIGFIPWYVSLGLCCFILVFALAFLIRSHNTLFHGEQHEPKGVISTGIFDQVRHPMYLGILLLYLAFIILGMSLLALGAWIVFLFIFDRLASFEEKVLEELFGESYREYKKRTSKWIPR